MSKEFNVIEAKLTSKYRSCVIGPLWQYDYGQVLRITGIELPEKYEVHFSNDPRGDAKIVIGDESGVRIPSEYLESGASVFAWIYVHQGECDGSTEYQIEIQVNRRAKPSTAAPTYEEKTFAAELIVSMNDTIDFAKESAVAAKSARNAAENARDAAESARDAAERAMKKAIHAAESVSFDPEKMGLEKDPETGYVYPTYDGTRSNNGIYLSAEGGVSEDIVDSKINDAKSEILKAAMEYADEQTAISSSVTVVEF